MVAVSVSVTARASALAGSAAVMATGTAAAAAAAEQTLHNDHLRRMSRPTAMLAIAAATRNYRPRS